MTLFNSTKLCKVPDFTYLIHWPIYVYTKKKHYQILRKWLRNQKPAIIFIYHFIAYCFCLSPTWFKHKRLETVDFKPI